MLFCARKIARMLSAFRAQVVASGTLASEAFATHEVCLAREKCYSLEVGGGEWQSEVSWSLGGNALYGGAPFGPRLFSVSFEGELVANCDTSREPASRARLKYD